MAKRSTRAAKEGEPTQRVIHVLVGPYRGQIIYAGEDYVQCLAEGWAVEAFSDTPVEEIPDLDAKIELANAMAAKWQESGGPAIVPVVPADPPVLGALDPVTAVLNDPDVTLHCHGSGFTPASTIVFAGQPEPTVFVADIEVTTVVKPSLAWGAVAVPVLVRNVDGAESAPLDFTFTEAGATRGRTKR